jgi:hypothetical protein
MYSDSRFSCHLYLIPSLQKLGPKSDFLKARPGSLEMTSYTDIIMITFTVITLIIFLVVLFQLPGLWYMEWMNSLHTVHVKDEPPLYEELCRSPNRRLVLTREGLNELSQSRRSGSTEPSKVERVSLWQVETPSRVPKRKRKKIEDWPTLRNESTSVIYL